MKKRNKLLFLATLSTACLLSLASCQGAQGPKGDQGDPGINGTNGSDGKNGTDGEDGKSVLSGKGVPASSLGTDGDSYIDTETFDFYVKSSGTWTKEGNIKGATGDKGDTGTEGVKGEDGTSVRTGKGEPSESLGNDGDSYIDLSNFDFYVKEDGKWSKEGSIKGEQGEKGEKGDKGNNGSSGRPGTDGAPGATAWSNTILPSTGGYVIPSVGSAVTTTLFRFNIFENDNYVAANLKLTYSENEEAKEEVILRGNFKHDDTLNCFYVEKEMIKGGYVVKASFTKTTDNTSVIDENGKAYDGVEEAIAGKAKTIILTKDSTVNTNNATHEVFYETAGDYTIDLAGHDLKFAKNNRLVLKNGANLTLTGEGTIKSETSVQGDATVESSDSSRGPIKIVSGTDGTTSKLTVDKEVTLEGDQGIVILNMGSSKAEIDVKGTIKAKFYGIAINGMNANEENIKVNVSGSIISSNDSEELVTTLGSGKEKKSYMSCGIYQAGPSIVTIEDGASITANDSAIETRAGHLIVNGGTFLAKSTTFRDSDNKNDDRRIVGAGLSIVQHKTKKDINVEINKGKFTGYYGLYARDILGNKTNNVSITLNGGEFESTLAKNGYYQGSDAYSFINNGATFTSNNIV